MGHARNVRFDDKKKSKKTSKRRTIVGNRKVKGATGTVAAYLTRSAALRTLQIGLRDFRRLCIIKGVYPRAPRKTPKGRDKVYYLTKDIKFLQHEPMLEHFQRIKIWRRRLIKFSARGETARAKRQRELRPLFRVDRVLRERYPTLEDALRDMDDALANVNLVALLPAGRGVPQHRIVESGEEVSQWQQYVIQSHSLRKMFISIKGYYFQAEVRGVPITWIVPHRFAVAVPRDVDTTVFVSFLEYQSPLLQFVMYKLYQNAGLAYPPKLVDDVAFDEAPPFACVQVERVDASSTTAGDAGGDDDTAAQPFPETSEQQAATSRMGSLFSSCVVFLSRETPADVFAFAIRACGGQVGWEGKGSPFSATDKRITHVIGDRPVTEKFVQRVYVQPQWIADCINAQLLLPTAPYVIGASLPPHLSPFVDNAREGYTPKRALEIESMQREAGVTPIATASEAVEPRGRDTTGEHRVGSLAEVENVTDETRKRARMLLPKKKRNLYDKMQHGIKERTKNARQLREKAEASSSSSSSAAAAASSSNSSSAKRTKPHRA